MKTAKLTLTILQDELAVCRMKADSEIPTWATKGHFFSVTRTEEELSIVCNQNNVPNEVKYEKDWKAFKVEGQLDFTLTGILSSLSNPLAKAGISIFAISTFNTDYVLVKSEKLDQSVRVLSKICQINDI